MKRMLSLIFIGFMLIFMSCDYIDITHDNGLSKIESKSSSSDKRHKAQEKRLREII